MANSSKKDNDGDNSSCPICCEDYTQSSWCSPMRIISNFFKSNDDGNIKRVKLSSCCNQHLCHTCLYSHIKSILEEGITLQGRISLSCPFLNCNSSISDACLRKSFSTLKHGNDNQQPHSNDNTIINRMKLKFSTIYESLKYGLYSIIYYCIICVIYQAQITMECILCNPIETSTKRSERYDQLILWKREWNFILLKSRQEKQDLELYERWSLTIALNCNDNDGGGDANNTEKSTNNDVDQNDANHLYTHVTRCPAPDCTCLWLTNRVYYNEKLKNERKYSSNKKKKASKNESSSSSFFPKSIIQSATTYFFYKPIHPTREEDIMNKNGFTTEHWFKHTDINIFPTTDTITSALPSSRTSTNYGTTEGSRSNRRAILNRNADSDADKDGRRTTCPSCSNTFCNLCLEPWHTLNSTSGKNLYHTNMTCKSYNKKSVSASDHNEFLNMADAGDARLCPGCSMRTNRTDGCNHMTCPCGYHWCYVCECKFDSRHYSCTDSNPLIARDSQANGCIIS